MICRGSKLLEEAKTLGEYGIKDNDFIIIMVAKPKPAPSTAAAATEQEAKKEEPAKVLSPAVNIQSSGAQPANPTPTNVQPAPV